MRTILKAERAADVCSHRTSCNRYCQPFPARRPLDPCRQHGSAQCLWGRQHQRNRVSPPERRPPQLTWKFASVSSCSKTSFMVSSTSTRNLRDLLDVSSVHGVSSACSSPRRVLSRTHHATCDDCEYPGLDHRCCAGAEWSEIPRSVGSMISGRSDRKAPLASEGSMRDAQH